VKIPTEDILAKWVKVKAGQAHRCRPPNLPPSRPVQASSGIPSVRVVPSKSFSHAIQSGPLRFQGTASASQPLVPLPQAAGSSTRRRKGTQTVPCRVALEDISRRGVKPPRTLRRFGSTWCRGGVIGAPGNLVPSAACPIAPLTARRSQTAWRSGRGTFGRHSASPASTSSRVCNPGGSATATLVEAVLPPPVTQST